MRRSSRVYTRITSFMIYANDIPLALVESIRAVAFPSHLHRNAADFQLNNATTVNLISGSKSESPG